MTVHEFNREGARRFRDLLPQGAKVLVSEASDLPFFVEMGFKAISFDASEQKIGFFNPPRASVDGIWADRSLFHYPPTLCLRAVQSFFAALKPKGILFISFLEHDQYTLEEYESLVRQSGFEPMMQGRNEKDPSQIAILARRI